MKIIMGFIFLSHSLAALAVSFKSVLITAVNTYPTIIKENAQLESNKAKRLKAYSEFLPSINLNSSKVENTSNGTKTDFSKNTITSQLNLFKFGSDIYNVKKQRLDYDKQVANIKLEKHTIEEQISADLFSYLENVKTIGIHSKILALKKHALAKAKKRYQLGRLSKQDLDKIEIDHLNAESNLSNKKILSLQLSQKVFEYTGEKKLDMDWPWDITFAQKLIRKLKTNLKFKHPSLEYTRFNEESAETNKKSIFGSMLGSLDLSYSKGHAEYNSGDIDDERVTLTFTIPLFSKFNDYSSLKESQVIYQYAKAYNFYNKRKVITNKHNSSLILNEAIATFEKRKRTLVLSEKIYKNSLKQFAKGLISVNDLLFEEDRLLKTQEFSITGNKSLHNAIVTFCHANGKEVLTDCI